MGCIHFDMRTMWQTKIADFMTIKMIFTARQRSCGKVMFSQGFVCPPRGGADPLKRQTSSPPLITVFPRNMHQSLIYSSVECTSNWTQNDAKNKRYRKW